MHLLLPTLQHRLPVVFECGKMLMEALWDLQMCLNDLGA